jgi:hypothetical protein
MIFAFHTHVAHSNKLFKSATLIFELRKPPGSELETLNELRGGVEPDGPFLIDRS